MIRIKLIFFGQVVTLKPIKKNPIKTKKLKKLVIGGIGVSNQPSGHPPTEPSINLGH
jgi:hypothetical protein